MDFWIPHSHRRMLQQHLCSLTQQLQPFSKRNLAEGLPQNCNFSPSVSCYQHKHQEELCCPTSRILNFYPFIIQCLKYFPLQVSLRFLKLFIWQVLSCYLMLNTAYPLCFIEHCTSIPLFKLVLGFGLGT